MSARIQPFIKLLHQAGLTEPRLLEQMTQAVVFKDLTAGHTLLRAGQRAEHFYILLKGLCRYYYLGPNGKQRNKAFFHEGQWVGSFSAYLRQEPCRYSIEILEPSVVACLPLTLVDQHRNAHPEFSALFSRLIEQILLRNEAREAMLLTCDNPARYRWLCEHEPWLLGRVAQYQLASYLSMDQVSLSRIKRKSPQN